MIDKKKKYKLGDFNYSLPKKFIAQYPETRRDYAKLMVVHKDSGEIEHRKFYNIVSIYISYLFTLPITLL